MLDFNEALNMQLDEIERPPLIPIGTYRWVVEKLPLQGEVGDGRFKTVDFPCRCLGPYGEADEEELAKYGDITQARLRHRFLISQEDEAQQKRGLFNLKRFLNEHLGIEGVSLNEALAESVNRQFVGTIRWRADPNDAERMYDEFERTAPID